MHYSFPTSWPVHSHGPSPLQGSDDPNAHRREPSMARLHVGGDSWSPSRGPDPRLRRFRGSWATARDEVEDGFSSSTLDIQLLPLSRLPTPASKGPPLMGEGMRAARLRPALLLLGVVTLSRWGRVCGSQRGCIMGVFFQFPFVSFSPLVSFSSFLPCRLLLSFPSAGPARTCQPGPLRRLAWVLGSFR